jgi:hypothetical protein
LKHDGERLESARPVKFISDFISAIFRDDEDQTDIHAGLLTFVSAILPDGKDQTGILPDFSQKLFT